MKRASTCFVFRIHYSNFFDSDFNTLRPASDPILIRFQNLFLVLSIRWIYIRTCVIMYSLLFWMPHIIMFFHFMSQLPHIQHLTERKETKFFFSDAKTTEFKEVMFLDYFFLSRGVDRRRQMMHRYMRKIQCTTNFSSEIHAR